MGLFVDGKQVARLCHINISVTWDQAMKKCASLGYRLFVVDTREREMALFKYYKDIAYNNEFRWINGIVKVFPDSPLGWYLDNTNISWNYDSVNWGGVGNLPIPGLCAGVIYQNNAVKFYERNCVSFKANFWCEY
jgi:hypothetical protein